MDLLTPSTLQGLPADIRRPAYDRETLAIGMAHIGVGAFHRCHQCEFTDDMLEADFGRWGVLGINLKPPLLSATLGRQDGLYSRTLRDGTSEATRIIGSMRQVMDVGTADEAEAAIARLASREIDVVTLTLTEKGYGHVPATGRLDPDRPDIAADLGGGAVPETALGLLARALDRRRSLGHGGMTLISCDNIPSNGEILRNGLLGFTRRVSPALADWIEAEIAFPSTMVDRIVPATSPGDIEQVAGRLGVLDLAPVVGEPFRQWVIEDRFAARRPPWDLAGAAFVDDVTPFELIKMRVLNAAQSTLSHLGALFGLDYSFEAAADPLLAAFTRRMLERETAGTLPVVAGMAVPAYIGTTFARIGNPAIHHRCHQIGTDGSQKIVQRILNPLRERLAAGLPADCLILAAASWIAYDAAGSNAFGARWQPADPYASAVIALADACGGDAERLAEGALSIEAVFGTDLRSDAMIGSVARHLHGLLQDDPRRYLTGFMAAM